VSLVTELRGIWWSRSRLVTGLVIGSAPPGGGPAAYLVVLSLIAGITRARGLAIVMLAELTTVLALPMLFAEVEGSRPAPVFAPWLLTSLGAGLLGAWLREIAGAIGVRPSRESPGGCSPSCTVAAGSPPARPVSSPRRCWPPCTRRPVSGSAVFVGWTADFSPR
jgi:hypothetical protein